MVKYIKHVLYKRGNWKCFFFFLIINLLIHLSF